MHPQRQQQELEVYEGPSVMEVVNMSIAELEAKAQQVEARAASLAASRGYGGWARSPMRTEREDMAREVARHSLARGGERDHPNSGYVGDPAVAPTPWELERLAQELPVVEARRAHHIARMATRIDSALRHVDGLSTHLDDLSARPAPPPLPSARVQPEQLPSARVQPEQPDREQAQRSSSGPVVRAELLLARLDGDDRGGALDDGLEELSRAESIQTQLVERLAKITDPSVRTELQYVLAETTTAIAGLRQQVRSLAVQPAVARQTPSSSLQSEVAREPSGAETGDFIIVGNSDQGPATLRRAPRPLMPAQQASTLPDEMNRLPVATPLVGRSTAVSARAVAEAEPEQRQAAASEELRSSARQQGASTSPRHRPEADALSELGLSLDPGEMSMVVLRAALQAYRNGPPDTIGDAISAVDKRDSGYLDEKELAQCVGMMGMVMTNTDAADTMREIDTDEDGLVSREDVEAWWEERIPPMKVVFTADEERERREIHRMLERKFKAREADLQRRISDTERQAKVEVAKRTQLEHQQNALQELASASTEDRKILVETQRDLAAARSELDSQRQIAAQMASQLPEERRLLAQTQQDLATTRAQLEAECRRATVAEGALQAERSKPQQVTRDPELEAQLHDAHARAEAAESAAAAAEKAQRASALASTSRIAELESRVEQADELEEESRAQRAELRRLQIAAQRGSAAADEIAALEQQLEAANASAATEHQRYRAKVREDSASVSQLEARLEEAERELQAAHAKISRTETKYAADMATQKAEFQDAVQHKDSEHQRQRAQLETRCSQATERADRFEQQATTAQRSSDSNAQLLADSKRDLGALQTKFHSAEQTLMDAESRVAELSMLLREQEDLARAAQQKAQAAEADAERLRHQAGQDQSAQVQELEQALRQATQRAEQAEKDASSQQREVQRQADSLLRQEALLSAEKEKVEEAERQSRAHESRSQAQLEQHKAQLDEKDDSMRSTERQLREALNQLAELEAAHEMAELEASQNVAEQEELVADAERKVEAARAEASRLREQAGQGRDEQVKTLEDSLRAAELRAQQAESAVREAKRENTELSSKLAEKLVQLKAEEADHNAQQEELRANNEKLLQKLAEVGQRQSQTFVKGALVSSDELAGDSLPPESRPLPDAHADDSLLDTSTTGSSYLDEYRAAHSPPRDAQELLGREVLKGLQDWAADEVLDPDAGVRADPAQGSADNSDDTDEEAHFDELPPPPSGTFAQKPLTRIQKIEISISKSPNGFGLEIGANGEVVATKPGSVAEAHNVPWPSQIVEINRMPVHSKGDIIAALQTAPDPVPFAFVYDASAVATGSQAANAVPEPMRASQPPALEPELKPTPAAAASSGESSAVAITSRVIPKTPAGFGLRIVNDGEVQMCTPGGTAEQNFVPVPSKIVEYNDQPVATKERIFELIKSTPMGADVKFVFAADPQVVAAADAAAQAAAEALDDIPPPPAESDEDVPPPAPESDEDVPPPAPASDEDVPPPAPASDEEQPGQIALQNPANMSIDEIRDRLKAVQGRVASADPEEGPALIDEINLLTGILDAKKAMSSTLPSAETGRYEGFMKKLSPQKGKGFQERYFVIDKGVLTYYKGMEPQALFSELDKDQSGYLDHDEVAQLCKMLGRKMGKKQVQAAMAEMDTDGNGEVSWTEFDAWWQVNGGKALKKTAPAGEIDLTRCTAATATLTKQGGPTKIEIETEKRTVTLLAGPGEDAAGNTISERWIQVITASIPKPGTPEYAVASQAIAEGRKGKPLATPPASVDAGGEPADDEPPAGLSKLERLRWKRAQKEKRAEAVAANPTAQDEQEGAVSSETSLPVSSAPASLEGTASQDVTPLQLSSAPPSLDPNATDDTPSKKAEKLKRKLEQQRQWEAAHPDEAEALRKKKGAAGTIVDSRIEVALKRLGLHMYMNVFAEQAIDLADYEQLDAQGLEQLMSDAQVVEIDHRELFYDWLLLVAKGQTQGAKALFPWPTPGADPEPSDLQFEKGDAIEVLSEDPGAGWWTGVVNGVPRKAIFPNNYVRVVRERQQAAVTAMPRYKGYLSKMSPKKGAGWQRRWFVLEEGKLMYFKGLNAEALFAELDADQSGFLDEAEVRTVKHSGNASKIPNNG